MNCTNGSYKYNKWLEKQCEIHETIHEICSCEPPFDLKNFPTKRKDLAKRDVWKKLINRQEENSNKIWSPKKSSRVCTLHFDGDLDYPTLHLGYDAESRMRILLPAGSKRRLKICNSGECSKAPRVDVDKNDFPPGTNNNDPTPPGTNDNERLRETIETLRAEFLALQEVTSSQQLCIIRMEEELEQQRDLNEQQHIIIQNQQRQLEQHNEVMKQQHTIIQNQQLKITHLRSRDKHHTSLLSSCKCKTPLYKVLLTSDKAVKLYTGFVNYDTFIGIFHLAKIFVRRKWRGVANTRPCLKPNRPHTRKRKLVLEDEYLLTMMKIRLGLNEYDLADRFKIAQSSVSRTFTTWVKALALTLKPMIFTPERDSFLTTNPERFRCLRNIAAIIDATEIFIETPHEHAAQKMTWSNYKHHNTAKLLVAIMPNSMITFVSRCYPGSISDKKITKDTEYLGTVPMHSLVMADKGFNIDEECLARNITLYKPPGKRGTYQMLPHELTKTKRIGNLRILVEQVIGQLKCFKIIGQEYQISLIPHIDNIVTICAALCNMMEPIFKD